MLTPSAICCRKLTGNLLQEIAKKSEKSMKIVNIEEESLDTF